MLLFPELEKPVSRLRQFGGGTVPPAVALETEFIRKQKGLSQRQLATLIGRSQGQYANAVRGHDRISAFAVNRLRDVLLAHDNQISGPGWISPVQMAA
jgi:predicted XRE-type DNA-binding protein